LRSRAEAKDVEICSSDILASQNKYELEAGEAFKKLTASNRIASAFKEALERALNQTVAIKKLSKELIQRRGDYEEFFKRAGQGGTPLSDDELSYSLIKARIPLARQVLEKIVQDPAIGRLASPTQIALAGLRLARMRIPHEGNNIWDRIGRPSPDFVSSLPFGNEPSATTKDESESGKKMRFAAAVANAFESTLRSTGKGDENCKLHLWMLNIRELLGGKSGGNGEDDERTAFPAILLGRLPKDMIDIGLMLVGLDSLSKIENKASRAFCLWCLTFGDASFAAYELAHEAVDTNNTEGENQPQEVFRRVIGRLEIDDHANLAPTRADLKQLREGIPASQYDDEKVPLLQNWNTRFKPNPDKVDPKIGSAISDMRFATSHGKNALLWLQRNYLGKNFAAYDPTSDRDEDLPIDLDHIVPQERFGFHWKEPGFPSGRNGEKLKWPADKETLDNLWRYRGETGNLIGNLRWLSSWENRGLGAKKDGRGAASLKGEDDLTDACDLIGNSASDDNPVTDLKARFGLLIDLGHEKPEAPGFSSWSTHNIRDWQYLVEMRQLELMRRLIGESGIEDLLPERKPRASHGGAVPS
jgi:hypothetical protein